MSDHVPRNILAAIATVLATLTTTFGAVPAHSSAEPRPTLELVGLTDEFVAIVTWATGLFEGVDLDLPPLRFVYHGDATEACSGRPGLHHRIDGVNVIEICTAEITNPTEGLILHEIAHAWIDRHLTDERKAEFRVLRGWTYWRDYVAAAWHENGTEQAAEIIVWGVIDRPLEMIRITQNSCAELAAGYRTLTGRDPVHRYVDAC